MRPALDNSGSSSSSRFASVEEMFSVKHKLDCVLWLAELKSYTNVRHKFNHVHPNQTAPIYGSVMRCDKRLKDAMENTALCHHVSVGTVSSFMVHHPTLPSCGIF
jgi:hypothetical protein